MPYKSSRTRTNVFASRRFARDQRRRVSNHSISLLRLRKDIQDQAKCSKTQSTAPGVEYIPFYIPLNSRIFLLFGHVVFVSSPRSLSVLKGGVGVFCWGCGEQPQHYILFRPISCECYFMVI